MKWVSQTPALRSLADAPAVRLVPPLPRGLQAAGACTDWYFGAAAALIAVLSFSFGNNLLSASPVDSRLETMLYFFLSRHFSQRSLADAPAVRLVPPLPRGLQAAGACTDWYFGAAAALITVLSYSFGNNLLCASPVNSRLEVHLHAATAAARTPHALKQRNIKLAKAVAYR